MTNQPRQPGFHCSSNQPPHLDLVVKQLEQATAGQGFLRRKQDIRGVAAKADPYYRDRGKADDLIVFLLDTGILLQLPRDKCVYFDAERAAYILSCCRSKKRPTRFADPTQRVFDILRAADNRPRPGPDPAPAVPKAPAKVPAAVVLSKVLYLTPPEEDVWNTLALLVEERPDGLRLSLPFGDGDARVAWVKEHLKCDLVFFSEMMLRLESAAVIKPLADAPSGTRHWRFVLHPFAYHVVRIKKRLVRQVREIDVKVAEALVSDFVPPQGPFMPAFQAFIESRFPGANANTYYTKMVSYMPKYQDKYWGYVIRHKVPGGSVMLVSVRSFEAVTLQKKTDALLPAAAAAPVPEVKPEAPGTVSPTPEAEVPPAPEPIASPKTRTDAGPPVSVRQLSAEDEERRRRLLESSDDERLDRIIQDTSVLLENAKKSLADAEAEKQRRDNARWEALFKRQGELTVERVSLSARLREVDQELADIAGKLPPEGHPFWKNVS